MSQPAPKSLPLLLICLGGCLGGCLKAPPPPLAMDAGVDAGEAPLEVRVEAHDRLGHVWPLDAAPRWPRIVVQLSRPLSSAEPAVLLLTGEPDDALLEDLASAPLRAANRARVLSAAVGDRALVVLEPPARMPRGASLTLALAAWGEPELVAGAWPIRVSEAEDAGTEVMESWPADGTGAVSPSLAELWLRFDGPVMTEDDLSLSVDGRAVPTDVAEASCEVLGWSDGACVTLRPRRGLEPNREHALEVGTGLLDPTGAPVGPWSARFTTAASPDVVAPSAQLLACTLDETPLEAGCALVSDTSLTARVAADEPVRVRLSVLGRSLTTLAPRGEAALRLDGLAPGQSVEGAIELTDLMGHTTAVPFSVITEVGLAALSISEVRANPVGPEPRQEYVEVLNSGDVPIDLRGFALSDSPDRVGDVVATSLVVAPGERVLWVADRFDAEGPGDDAVPPGVRLVRVGTSLASGGLSNAGEPLFLRDASLRRLSAAPARATAPGRCLARRAGADLREGSEAAFEERLCRPGRP